MGKGEPILVRLQPAQLAALDAWIGRQDAQLSRPEAIRRLVEQGARTIAVRPNDAHLDNDQQP